MIVNPKEIEKVSALESFERYKYFIKRVADNELIYILLLQNGEYALSEIENKILLPIWPAKEFVEICKINGWENCNVKEITLEEFENDIIDYISESGYLINVFPVFESTGFIVDLDEFAEDLSNELNKYS